MEHAQPALVERVLGSGPEVVLIHGAASVGEIDWAAQEPLADRWTLRIVDRVGYGASASLSDGEDIELDASLVATAIDGSAPVHLVGHSSGAMVALLVAAAAPGAVRSLTINEPPTYRFVDDEDVQHLADGGEALFARTDLSDRDWLLGFFDVYGEEAPPDEAVEMMMPHVPTFRGLKRLPWDIELPVERIRDAGVPVLATSGGYDPRLERLNDQLGEALGARRAVIPGAGHEVPSVGQPFNDVLAEFLNEIDTAEPAP